MSNTLNTPIEALEREFPLRVMRYALRRGSGGAGATRGGDGVVRELQALREMDLSLIGERRRHAPRGADGGGAGAPGRDLLDGEPLPGKVTGTLRAGQRLRIETPGGGGFGPTPVTIGADDSCRCRRQRETASRPRRKHVERPIGCATSSTGRTALNNLDLQAIWDFRPCFVSLTSPPAPDRGGTQAR